MWTNKRLPNGECTTYLRNGYYKIAILIGCQFYISKHKQNILIRNAGTTREMLIFLFNNVEFISVEIINLHFLKLRNKEV